MYSCALTRPSSFAVLRNASTAAWRSSGQVVPASISASMSSVSTAVGWTRFGWVSHCLQFTEFVVCSIEKPFSVVKGHVSGQRRRRIRSEEHTSELQSRLHLVCRLLLEKKKKKKIL